MLFKVATLHDACMIVHLCMPCMFVGLWLHFACLLACILSHACLGRIAFGMLVTLALCTRLSHIAYGMLMHALHYVWFGVSNQT